MDTDDALEQKYAVLCPHLNERQQHLVAAADAERLGRGGITLVARASGFARPTLYKALRDLHRPPLPLERVRCPGAGRKKLVDHDPHLVQALEQLIDPDTRGDPMSPLRWTCKSTRQLAQALSDNGHAVSHETVAQLLHQLGYSLQANAKTQEGKQHPDRDAQFRYIARQSKYFQARSWPVVSVDTKKKELVGNYANSGREWRRAKSPRTVNGHDFPHPSVPRAYPYGIYDLGRNAGFVNVGTDHDTGAFAVASIRGWWRFEGCRLYPKVRKLLIAADAGGSNVYQLRRWTVKLQEMADSTGLTISVCHFPPGTSKWNKVEHRLFSFISSNWRGEPLRDYETVARLIASTTTARGLSVICRLDRRRYPTGRKVGDKEFATINLTRDAFHGEWNYVI